MDWFTETFIELLFFLACFWLGALAHEAVDWIFQKLYPDVSEEEYVIFFSNKVFYSYWSAIEAAGRRKRP